MRFDFGYPKITRTWLSLNGEIPATSANTMRGRSLKGRKETLARRSVVA